jgi:hypothetical protein
MSRLLKMLYDVAEIRCRYHRVHEEVVGFSARRFLRSINPAASDATKARKAELDRLLLRLEAAREDLHRLGEHDLSVRRGREIRDALTHYVEALAKSSASLKELCEYSKPETDAPDVGNRDQLTALKVAYDDAVQYQKRLGKRLNELIESL